ncbi:glycosyltransferase family 1 protein [Brevundimonas sp. LM2]|uniref:glycosyltransferase family 4 protein n=1 Tax=Brevundimonas sp. LM2 TaxID=1938605 RepID=UPI000987D44A|nr:glycosyltransferase family 1 protein [Brevundimonas sp. LM2]
MARFSFFWRTASSRLGRTAYPIRPAPNTVWPSGRRPQADRLWLSPSLYRLGNRCYSRYGAETGVKFRASIDHPAPSVMHWTSPLPIYAQSVPNIYTFHDLIQLRFPELTSGNPKRYAELCNTVLKRADHISVVSETTRRELIDILGVPWERITNTYQAVDIPDAVVSSTPDDVEAVLDAAFNLHWKGYYLHFGAIEPKKNLGRIVEAYVASGVRTPLVIVGAPAWMSEGETALLERIAREGGDQASRIKRYEYLPLHLLLPLIKGARAVVFPSLYEGFGLPVLEAMTLGTAVLTSTAGSLPEIVGTAAFLVDPYDVNSIARGFRAIDGDDSLREGLERGGVVRAADFSTTAYKARLVELYSKVGVDIKSSSETKA